jgi:hypothetical protein
MLCFGIDWVSVGHFRVFDVRYLYTGLMTSLN